MIERRREDRHNLVIVPLRNRIVLVRVALRTTHGQSQHIGGKVLNQSLHNGQAQVRRVQLILVCIVIGGAQKPGGNEQVLHFRRVLLGRAPVHQFVPGELFGNKTVVGLVFV